MLHVGHQGAAGAPQIDAVVFKETAVFGRERGFDQVVGNFIEWYRIVVQDAALAKLVAIGVEKFDREFSRREFALVEFKKGRERERVEHDEAAGCDRQAFRQRFVQEAAPAVQLEADKETVAAVPDILQPGP